MKILTKAEKKLVASKAEKLVALANEINTFLIGHINTSSKPVSISMTVISKTMALEQRIKELPIIEQAEKAEEPANEKWTTEYWAKHEPKVNKPILRLKPRTK